LDLVRSAATLALWALIGCQSIAGLTDRRQGSERSGYAGTQAAAGAPSEGGAGGAGDAGGHTGGTSRRPEGTGAGEASTSAGAGQGGRRSDNSAAGQGGATRSGQGASSAGGAAAEAGAGAASPATGGNAGTTGGFGGRAVTGGAAPAGGRSATGGAGPLGGSALGGAPPRGGSASGGLAPAGGRPPTGGVGALGGSASGGVPPLGGSASGGGPPVSGGAEDGGAAAGGAGTGGGTGSGGTDDNSSGCGKTTTLEGESEHTITVGGADRSYILRLPDSYDEHHPYRLILSYHPIASTAAQVASGFGGTNYEYYGLWRLADGSTIFVAPQGTEGSGSLTGWDNKAGADVEFTHALVNQLAAELCIDTSRIFAEGFSMGGGMAYALACAMHDTFRAVAVHSGGAVSGCDKTDRGPVAYFMTHGTEDTVLYPDDADRLLRDFAGLNGCADAQTLTMPIPAESAEMPPACVDFSGCSVGHPTRACLFFGEHTPCPPDQATTWVPQETWSFITQF
jgi:poly(3-hydroxybutyrate) depolymerase